MDRRLLLALPVSFFPVFSWALYSFAADAPSTVPVQQYQDVVSALRDQRDQALDGLAAAQVQIAELKRQIAEARKPMSSQEPPK